LLRKILDDSATLNRLTIEKEEEEEEEEEKEEKEEKEEQSEFQSLPKSNPKDSN